MPGGQRAGCAGCTIGLGCVAGRWQFVACERCVCVCVCVCVGGGFGEVREQLGGCAGSERVYTAGNLG